MGFSSGLSAIFPTPALSARLRPGKSLAYHKHAHYICGVTQFAPDRSFGFLLHDIARLLRKRYEQRARPLGLTRAQWQALAFLQRNEGINQSGLAELLDLEPITLARLVDRMEEAGLVERRDDPADRRAHRLYLTGRAQPMLERGRALADTVYDEAFAGVANGERDRVIDLLARVRGNLSERRGDGEARSASAQRPTAETSL
jgi:MarR family transcriptional regulator, transcriptional regulator for hemolysin